MDDPTPHCLSVETDDGFELVPIPEGETTIGRSSRNDLVLREGSVSREQCALERRGDAIRVRDSDSRNATRLRRRGDERLKRADGRVLGDGDVLVLGRVELTYRGASTKALAPEEWRARRIVAPEERDAGAGEQPPVVGAVRVEPGAADHLFEPLAREDADRDPSSAPGRRTVRPRRRALAAARSSRDVAALGTSLFALGALAMLLAAVVIVLRRGAPDDRDAAIGRADLDASRREREARIAQLEARDSEREAELRRTRAQLEELRALQTQLEQALRGRAAERTADAERAALLEETERRLSSTREAIERLAKQEDELSAPIAPVEIDVASSESAAESREVERERSPRTRVERIPPPTALTKTERSRLVERMREAVGNYALLSASPRDLEPDLPRLVGEQSEAAARGLIEVFEYAQELEREMDATVSFLERRVEALLAQAQKIRDDSARTRGYGAPSHSQELEQLQRALELSTKKIEIKRRQRVRLVALRDAVGEALGELVSDEATRHIAKTFGRRETSPELRRRLLPALAKGRALHAVPVLTRGLRSRDDSLDAAIEATLVAITGERLGSEAGPWETWWREHGSR